jgi:hypothetical protein
MQRKNTLNPLAKRYFADRERAPDASPFETDDHTLEDLDALLLSLADFGVDTYGHTGPNVRTLLPLSLLDRFNRIHRCHLVTSVTLLVF